jgi:hypothetical protein
MTAQRPTEQADAARYHDGAKRCGRDRRPIRPVPESDAKFGRANCTASHDSDYAEEPKEQSQPNAQIPLRHLLSSA